MTNREWLETLSDEELASEISARCGLCAKQDLVECDCVSNITTWMTQEYVPPKKELSETDIVKEFENVFQDRGGCLSDNSISNNSGSSHCHQCNRCNDSVAYREHKGVYA